MSTLSRLGSSSQSPASLHCWCWLWAGRWSVGAGPGSGSSPRGDPPSTCASCGVAQPGPPPWPLAPGKQLYGNLASALTPSQDPTSLHSAPTVPWHRAPRGGLLSVLLAVTPASFPRPWGLCRDSPVPPGDLPHPLCGAPHSLGRWTAVSASAGGGGGPGRCSPPPPQPQDTVDGAALHPLSSGPSSGRFCSGPVAGP